MNKQTIKISNHAEEIPIIVWEKDPKKITMFISGDRDTKDSFIPIAHRITSKSSLASFSFRGRETGKKYSIEQQVNDLQEVITFLLSKGYEHFYLAPVSTGFISVAHLFRESGLSLKIKGILMLDPADYPLDRSRGTWTGRDKFDPRGSLLSSYLNNITHKMIIDVVFFGLKNINMDMNEFSNKPFVRRGDNLLDGYTRLNKDMILNIYDSIPEHVKGVFVIDNTIPHAFKRDGDVHDNQEKIAEYISNFMEKMP